MKDPQEVWQRYTDAWGAESAAEKRALFETCLAPACVYSDPTVVLKGWDELTEYMVNFHKQIPGGHFIVDEFMSHHRCSVARWRMLGGDGTKMGDGISYAEYDDSGMLVAISGFWTPGAPP